MTAYYNEIDPGAAEWLRNLIAAGRLPAGDVDTRSIEDVRADDLDGYTQCHFFAGIGGWALAARLAGWPDDRELWTGSCPCQPFSVAGKQGGADDPRHLWPHYFRLIRARRPVVAMGEQVAAAVGKHWLDGVFADLEGINYACGAVVVPACAVNAPHRRDRLWFVAERGRAMDHGEREGLEGYAGNESHAQGRAQPDRSAAATGRGGNVADAHQSHASEKWQQRSGQLGGIGGDTESGYMANSNRFIGEQRRAFKCGRDQGSSAQPRAGFGGSGCGSDVADANQPGLHAGAHARVHSGQEEAGTRHVKSVRHRAARDGSVWVIGHDGKARRVEPGIRLLVDGVSPWMAGRRASAETASRQVALKGFGNAIVPQVAAEIIAAWMEAA